MKRNKIINADIEYRIIVSLFKLLRCVPRKMGIRAGEAMGRLWRKLDKKRRTIAGDNLENAFGRWMDAKSLRCLEKKVFGNLGRILYEVAWFMGQNPRTIPRYFQVDNFHYYHDAYRKGRGVLILTAHIGNWELLPVIGALSGYPVNVLYRPLDYQPLDRFFIHFRSRFGFNVIPTAHSMRKILKALQRGEIIALLMDQNVDWYEGVYCDFFGKKACTNKGLAILALKTETPVVPAFLMRKNGTFLIEFKPEIPLIKTGDKTRDIEENTQQYNRIIENCIRRYPDQWLWVHHRYKTPSFLPWPKKQ